jgi:DNA-binding NarL/FixJ family response regulator
VDADHVLLVLRELRRVRVSMRGLHSSERVLLDTMAASQVERERCRRLVATATHIAAQRLNGSTPPDLNGAVPPGTVGSQVTNPLTSREIEVLRLVADGYADKEIAAELGLSRYTVHTHLRHVLKKTRTTSRTEATVLALRKGYLS